MVCPSPVRERSAMKRQRDPHPSNRSAGQAPVPCGAPAGADSEKVPALQLFFAFETETFQGVECYAIYVGSIDFAAVMGICLSPMCPGVFDILAHVVCVPTLRFVAVKHGFGHDLAPCSLLRWSLLLAPCLQPGQCDRPAAWFGISRPRECAWESLLATVIHVCCTRGSEGAHGVSLVILPWRPSGEYTIQEALQELQAHRLVSQVGHVWTGKQRQKCDPDSSVFIHYAPAPLKGAADEWTKNFEAMWFADSITGMCDVTGKLNPVLVLSLRKQRGWTVALLTGVTHT